MRSVVFFLIVNEVGVNVLAVVGHVFLLSVKLFPDALFGKDGCLTAFLVFAFLASLLEIVECEVELIDKENQQQECENDDDTCVADIIGQQSVEPQADCTTKDGAFWRRSCNESEEQWHPHQAE